jgi:hypothetical protein
MALTTPTDENSRPASLDLAIGPKASQALAAVLTATDAERVTLGELVAALHERAFGFILLIVALINCVPLPPGASTIAGIPVLLVGVQMLFGRHQPWLPAFIARRSFRRLDLLAAVQRISPYLARLEKVARPRYPRLLHALQPNVVGLTVVALGLFIVTPMVFTNIPPAIASVFLAVALIEEDGLVLAVGLVLAIAAMMLSATLAASAVAAVLYAGSRMFGL